MTVPVSDSQRSVMSVIVREYHCFLVKFFTVTGGGKTVTLPTV